MSADAVGPIAPPMLAKAHGDFVRGCVALLADLIDDADDALFELASATDDDHCRGAAFDLARALHVDRPGFLDRFACTLHGDGLAAALSARPEPDAHAVQLAIRAIGQFGPLLTRLGERYAALSPDPALPETLPFAPAQVAVAYIAARAELKVDPHAASYLDTLFVRLVVDCLGRVYGRLYGALALDDDAPARCA